MKTVTILLCLTPLLALSDGIPFDARTQRVTVPHKTLTLTEAQQHELSTLHRVTLTAQQRARFTEHWPSFPDIIQQVLPHNWGDCTCVVGHPYAILPAGTTIAVTYSEADFVTRYGSSPSYMPPPAKPTSAWSRFWTPLRGHKSQ